MTSVVNGVVSRLRVAWMGIFNSWNYQWALVGVTGVIFVWNWVFERFKGQRLQQHL